MDRWKVLEMVLQLLVLPLETIYFIITNSWTQSMIRVIIEVAVDLTMNSVLGGASVAVATIMLLRDMGGPEMQGNAAAGDATAPAKEELLTRRTVSTGLRPKMPLVTTTKPMVADGSPGDNTSYLNMKNNDPEVLSWINSNNEELYMPNQSRTQYH